MNPDHLGSSDFVEDASMVSSNRMRGVGECYCEVQKHLLFNLTERCHKN